MTNKLAIGILLFVWALIELLIFPVGEFPLNDDWCYAIPVRDLLNGENLRIVNWGSMTLLTQIGWGFLFTKLFGFSFLTLRFSVIVLGIIGSVYLYYILESETKNKIGSLLMCLLYISNPLQINLANTFMTDVPFCSFSIVCIYYIKRMFETDFKLRFVILANILLIITILLRQLGIFLSIGILFTVFWQKDRSKFFYAILPLILGIITLWGYEKWLVLSGNSINNYYRSSQILSQAIENIPLTIFHLFHRISVSYNFIGLGIFPLTMWSAFAVIKNIKKEKWKLALPFFILSIICILRGLSDFPYHNVFSSTYLGAKILYDIDLFNIRDIQNNLMLTCIFKFFWIFRCNINFYNLNKTNL